MSKPFMQNHKVYLTPLSPIHIGCGEDFEPTNYVIQNKVLYHFDPSRIYLSSEQRDELKNYAQRSDLLLIQRFFKKYAHQVAELSHYVADIVSGVANEWENRIGKVAQREQNGNEVIAKLAIERNAYLPHRNEPYIPGSSFKGALATALLDAEHQKRGNPKMKAKHNDLLKQYLGDFADSKLRLVKFADFIPIQNVQSKIYYSLNFKKKPSDKGILGKGVPLRRECIMAGQYHAFESQLSLWDKAPFSLQDLFNALTQYYQPIFEQECELLVANRLVDQKWVTQVRALLNRPNVALIRLGKNGADSKIYRADGMAQIKIMTGKGKSNDHKDRSTTLWLAGHQQKQQSDLHPLGWALVEIASEQENEVLKQWCDKQSVHQAFDKTAFLAEQAEIKKQKQAEIEAELAEKQAKSAQKLTEEQVRQQQLVEREKALSSVNENQRMVLEMLNTLTDIKQPLQGSNRPPEFVQFEKLCEVAQDWNDEDRAFLIEKITLSAVSEKIILSKKAFDKFKKYGLKKS